MKLLGSITSPYVRKVRVVLAEKKIDYEFQIVIASDPDGPVRRYNPLARVPVLVLDDDSAIFDSPVIVEYLDSAAPNNKLLPQPSRERIEVKRREALADGLLDAAVSARMESVRPENERSPASIERNRMVIHSCLEWMSRELGDNAWCMGTPFGLADIAVGCALGYLDLRFADIDWRSAYPNLDRLHDKLMQRSSFAETVPRV
ncbi:MAG: glutathione S-transferase N-terminal domain-containing protein [Rhodocyclaceae bacterium]|nr:glutathione S-transferase N-terminal domain-containing protein [Rhodocyclaceae bacterium]